MIFLKAQEQIQTPECREPGILLMSLVSYTWWSLLLEQFPYLVLSDFQMKCLSSWQICRETCEFSSGLEYSCQKWVCCFCQNIFLLHLELVTFQSQQSLHSQNMSLINVCTVFLQPVRDQIICKTLQRITSLVPSWASSVWFCSAQQIDSSCLKPEINWDVANCSGSSECKKRGIHLKKEEDFFVC